LDKGSTVTLHLSKGRDLRGVPKLVGLTEKAARAALARAGLGLGPINHDYSDTVATGKVIVQTAAVGKKLRRSTKVGFTVSKGPRPITVPNVVGKSLADARETLVAVGFAVASPTYAYDERVPAGRVIRTSPTAGTTAHAKDTVAVTVSKGPPVVAVPNVVGASRQDAQRILARAGLKVHYVDYPGFIGSVVARQSPKPGKMVRVGSTVTCYMTFA
jgi:serine/threonine-protein kinase